MTTPTHVPHTWLQMYAFPIQTWENFIVTCTYHASTTPINRPHLFQCLHTISAKYTRQAPGMVKSEGLWLSAHGRLPGTLVTIAVRSHLPIKCSCERKNEHTNDWHACARTMWNDKETKHIDIETIVETKQNVNFLLACTIDTHPYLAWRQGLSVAACLEPYKHSISLQCCFE